MLFRLSPRAVRLPRPERTPYTGFDEKSSRGAPLPGEPRGQPCAAALRADAGENAKAIGAVDRPPRSTERGAVRMSATAAPSVAAKAPLAMSCTTRNVGDSSMSESVNGKSPMTNAYVTMSAATTPSATTPTPVVPPRIATPTYPRGLRLAYTRPTAGPPMTPALLKEI
jgi:hypothetical protein